MEYFHVACFIAYPFNKEPVLSVWKRHTFGLRNYNTSLKLREYLTRIGHLACWLKIYLFLI